MWYGAHRDNGIKFFLTGWLQTQYISSATFTNRLNLLVICLLMNLVSAALQY